MECINCGKPAVWVFKTSGVAERPYCNVHLPAAYRATKSVRPVSQPADEALPAGAPTDPGPDPEPLPDEIPVEVKKGRRNKAVEEQVAAEEAAPEPEAGDLEK